MSNKKDFATSTVLTAPSTPTAGTSLVVESGHGARFPSAPFYVTVHPPSEMPTLDNAEKLLVSAKSTDTFTITRAQGDTTAKTIAVGWRVSNTVFLADFPATFDDLTDGSTNKAFTSTLKTKVDGIEAAADVTDGDNVGAAMTGATAKTTPVDADTMPLNDSAASNVIKKVTWANIKATLKTYFDTLYATVSHTHAFSALTSKPTTLSGYGITDAQALDTDLTTIAGLSATTDNFMQAKSSAWASRTPAQVAADLAIEVGKLLYPVGSVVTMGVSTNPGTLLGFGTWTAITGRVVVGKAASGTFGTLDATGGAETHTLTTAEMPSHTHQQDFNKSVGGITPGGGVGQNSNSAPSVATSSTGGDGAHNNLQPYIVKYVWQRTA